MDEMVKLNGFYRARVENNGYGKDFEGKTAVADTESRCRVQLRVLGVHTFNTGDKQFTDQPDGNIDDVIPLKYLPWAEQANSIAFNMSVNAETYSGLFCLPSVGSWVWVFFEQGDPMSPVYFASMMAQNGAEYYWANSGSPQNILKIQTRAGHVIQIDDSVDTSGKPTGGIMLQFNDGSGGESTINLQKDLIAITGKSVSIGGERVSIGGSKAVEINGSPAAFLKSKAEPIELQNIGFKST